MTMQDMLFKYTSSADLAEGLYLDSASSLPIVALHDLIRHKTNSCACKVVRDSNIFELSRGGFDIDWLGQGSGEGHPDNAT